MIITKVSKAMIDVNNIHSLEGVLVPIKISAQKFLKLDF